MLKRTLFTALITTSILVPLSIGAGAAEARTSGQRPALVITNDPLPPEQQNKIISEESQYPNITPAQVTGESYFADAPGTVVGQRIDELRNELFSLQGAVAKLSEELSALENNGRNRAAEYYASVATINTQLQAGTTPGNPRLVKRLDVARTSLDGLSENISQLNDLARRVSDAAALSAFLLESSRAAYSLSGAIEEDHERLAELEDAVNSTVVVIDRLLNNVNDDITRTVAYMGTERENMRTLSLAITTGNLFGPSLSNRPFANAQQAAFAPDPLAAVTAPLPSAYSSGAYGSSYTPAGIPATVYPDLPAPSSPAYNTAPSYTPSAAYAAPAPVTQDAVPGGPRALVKIRFDRADVPYEQPVYMAVNEALSRYPGAKFQVVAIHPSTGNAAKTAIESTRARRNAEKVLRSLKQMGIELDRIDLSYTPSAEATTNEVHIYVR